MKKQSLIIGFLLAFLLPAFALAAQVSVSLGANSISPSTVDINAGDTVVWNNTSNTTQSVTADNGGFQSGVMNPGGQFAATFSQSGTYNYYDNASSGAILGEVVVGGTSATTPVATSYVNPNYTTTTSTSNAAQAASLTSEVQSLIAEIDALEGNSSASVSTSGSVSGAPSYTVGGTCPQIGRVLSYGSSGSDVTGLQEFLGVTPATGFYGPLTQSAVQQWQAANNIISYGTPATTGYGVVGPRTEAAIRLACSQGQTSSSTSSGTGTGTGNGTVSGYLQVTPVSGEAPLAVTVTATVNVANSCTGATYTLDFGDGTAQQVIPVTQGNCAQQNETFQHTYQYGGSYTIALSAGAHSSTATVTVSGPAAPSTTTTTTTTPATPVTPSGTITAPVSSGAAPLTSTFYVSCTSGLAFDVTFGDGTDLGSANVSQSTCTGGLQAVTHVYSKAGSYTAQLIIFSENSSGTISSQTVGSQAIVATGTTSSSPSTTATPTPAASYPPPTLTPDVGNNPLMVTLSFAYDSSDCNVSIQWGDTSTYTSPTCSNFTGQTQNFTQSHTYASGANYTVTLMRNSQTDTTGASIVD